MRKIKEEEKRNNLIEKQKQENYEKTPELYFNRYAQLSCNRFNMKSNTCIQNT